MWKPVVSVTLAGVVICGVAALLFWRGRAGAPSDASIALSQFAGTVRDSRLRPIENAAVRAAWISGDRLPRELARAVSKSDGTYALGVALPYETGVLLLGADADGFGTTERRVDAQVARQDFVLLKGSTTVTVHVIDEAGLPVAGSEVIVSIEPTAGERDAVNVFAGTSDAAGEVVARSVPVIAGAIHWSAIAPGRGRARGTLQKRAGADPIAIIARIDEGTALAGQVVDSAGHPIQGVPLRAGEVEGPWMARAESDGEGRFRITGAPRSTGLGIGPEGDWVLEDGQESVALITPARESPAPARLVVEPAGTIRGHVTSAAGPVAGAAITAAPGDRVFGAPHETVSAANGSFTLRGLRSNTSWDLEARSGSHAPVFEDHIPAHSDAVVLRMIVGGGITGRVVDGSNTPYEQVEVYAHRVTQREGDMVGLREYASVRTDRTGGFTIDHLNPGDYRVEYRSPAHMAFSPTAAVVKQALVVDALVVTLEDVRIERGGRLRIIVEGSMAPQWLTVSILPSGRNGAPHQAQLWAGKPGLFEIDNVEPGAYDVSAQNRDLGYAHAPGVRVTSHTTAEVTLQFAGVLAVTGRILDAGGTPVAGAAVEAYLPDAGSQRDYSVPGRAPDNFSGNSTRSEDDGSFRLSGLTAGGHRLRVVKPGEPPSERAITVTAGLPPVTVRLPRGASLDVAIAAGKAAADKVVLLETGDGGGHHASAITDAGGLAHFTALPPGTYRVGAVVDGVEPATVALDEGQSRQVVLETRANHP